MKSTYANGTIYFDHADWLGSERVRSGLNGQASEQCANLPFGDGMNCTGGTDTSPIHFTGQEHDTESGLDNFLARYNSSALGRSMSPDPGNFGANLNDPQSWNMYAYVDNNPLNFVDPFGLGICDDLGSESCLVAQSRCLAGGGGSTCAQFNQSLNCQMDSISVSCGAVAPMLARSCTIACSVSVYTPPTTIGAFGPLGWQSTSEPASWATFNLTSYINPPDVPLEPDARRILALTGVMAERGVKGGAEGLALSGLAGGLSSAAASLEWAHIAVGEFEGNIHFAFEADGQWAHYLEDWNGEMRLSRWFVRDFVENAKIIPVPVLNTGGIMPAAAETAANCFTGACSALWGGW